MNNQTDTFSEWLNSYAFEALVTVRLPPNLPIHEVHKYFISDIIRPLAKFNHTKIGAYTIIIPTTGYGHAHLHSLIVSFDNKLSTAIDESLTHVHALKTKLNSHAKAIDIKLITFSGGVNAYVAKHLTPNAEFMYYNQWLVAKNKRMLC